MNKNLLKRTWAEINLDALRHNVETLRAGLPGHPRFLGVVKADAYGHGAVPVARELERLGAEFLAVSNYEEAVQLRRGDVSLPILILGYTPPEYAPEEAALHIRQEVHSLEYGKALSEALRGSGHTLEVHVKLDTGMSRLGFFGYDHPETPESFREELARQGMFSYTMTLRADYGDRVRDYTLDCVCPLEGPTELTVLAPEIARDITATVGGGDATVSFHAAISLAS